MAKPWEQRAATLENRRWGTEPGYSLPKAVPAGDTSAAIAPFGARDSQRHWPRVAISCCGSRRRLFDATGRQPRANGQMYVFTGHGYQHGSHDPNNNQSPES